MNEQLLGMLSVISKSENGLLEYIEKSPKKCNISRSQLIYVSVNVRLL